MTDENSIKRNGQYLGTEINEKWWRRYSKNSMLARGNGIYWYDDNSFLFLRKLTKTPISISFKDIIEFKIGKWHSGKWGAGNPVLKIIWNNNSKKMSSGFIINKEIEEVNNLVKELKYQIGQIK